MADNKHILDAFRQDLEELCKQHGVVLVFDREICDYNGDAFRVSVRLSSIREDPKKSYKYEEHPGYLGNLMSRYKNDIIGEES